MSMPYGNENPYTAPKYVDRRDDPDTLLRSVVLLFRGMAGFGVAYELFTFTFVGVSGAASGALGIGAMLFLLGLGAVTTLIFAYVFWTTSRLQVNFARHYNRARWIAILAAVIFFPILSIPAVIALSRLENYRALIAGRSDKLA